MRDDPAVERLASELDELHQAMRHRAEKMRQQIPDGPLVWVVDETVDLITLAGAR
jgi:hypothetical protein